MRAGGQLWSDAGRQIRAGILDLRPPGQRFRAACRSKGNYPLGQLLLSPLREPKLERDAFLAPQLAKSTAHRVVFADQRPSPVCARRTRTPSRIAPASRIDLTRAVRNYARWEPAPNSRHRIAKFGAGPLSAVEQQIANQCIDMFDRPERRAQSLLVALGKTLHDSRIGGWTALLHVDQLLGQDQIQE